MSPRSSVPREAPSPILDRLAARVRARRQALSLTLRELGAMSGLSERFLVLLEGGKANVSVTRLEDVARALGTTGAELIAGPPLDGAPARRASSGGILVALLGLRGAGKTAIGVRASER